MSGLRFKTGDLARFVVARYVEGISDVGKVVEIAFVGCVSNHGNLMDYACYLDGKPWGSVYDWQLQPINPPAEPASLTRSEECGVEA